MDCFKLIAICLYGVALYHLSSAQNLGNFDSYSRLEYRVNSLNSSFVQQQRQLNNLISDINARQNSQEVDIREIKTQLRTVQGKVGELERRTQENSNLISSTNLKLTSVEQRFEDLSAQMAKLNAANELWRSNFQVVNRTFAELKKKFTFNYAVSVIPG